MNEPVTVTYSLEEVLKPMEEASTKRFDQLESKLDAIQKDVTDVKIEVVEIKTELKGVNKRLDSQEFLNRSVTAGFILAFVSGLIKLFFPNFLNFLQ
ncbi:MAG: hypothetical protein WBM32_04975 [Crocosphaera sp.]